MPLLTYTPRFITTNDPYQMVEWETRDALISHGDGNVVFSQKNVEVPKSWSQQALNIVANKYLRGYVSKDGTPGKGRETSIRQLIDRVVDTIAGWAGYALDGETVEIPDDWSAWSVYHGPTGKVEAVAPGSLQPADWTFKGNVVYKRPKRTLQPKHEVYFANRESWEAWKNDLKYLMVAQIACFNSPVWFNVGVDEHPQCSACFIVKMEDWYENEGDKPFDLNAHGLLAAQVKEGIIFSKGSGSGINLSRIRSSKEWLSNGGRPSGPLSFAEGLDAWATVTKSGGKTRRAAKMLIMDVDHPDIREFIRVKAEEEKIAKALIAAGYPGDMDGIAYRHSRHQNSNLSTRLSDAFMRAVDKRESWALISRSYHHLPKTEERVSMIGKKGLVVEEVNAYELMREIGQSCWESGDPGVQFSDTINDWHTCADTEPIVATNPCSEYVFLDETACNLASLNLSKFYSKEKGFEHLRLAESVRTMIIAMEVLVSNSRYPTENFAKMSHMYRTLGLGFANLGGLLMRMGISYDSATGREIAASISSLIASSAYATSVEMASTVGPFPEYINNLHSVIRVMKKHKEAAAKIVENRHTKWMNDTADSMWDYVVKACESGRGIRNAQTVVIAPTGTIAFMMDCETTGIEPELALVKYKQLSGGGRLKIVNPLAEEVINSWGITTEKKKQLLDRILSGKSVRTGGDDPFFPLFDILRTSFAPSDDPDFALSWRSHIDMMAAVQPFVSGAISKTVNMPESSTVEDIIGAYTYAWHLGLKCVAVYRDNCKAVQPLSTQPKADGSKLPSAGEVGKEAGEALAGELHKKIYDAINNGARRKLTSHVATVRCKFKIEGHKGYLHIGFYPDTWDVAEIFIKLSKMGSATGGFADQFCRLFSVCLQYGVPLEELYEGIVDTTFEPNGIVQDDPDVRSCRSVPDYIVQKVRAVQDWVKLNRRLPLEGSESTAVLSPGMSMDEKVQKAKEIGRHSGKVCKKCGGVNVLMLGKCFFCTECGDTEGGCYA